MYINVIYVFEIYAGADSLRK